MKRNFPVIDAKEIMQAQVEMLGMPLTRWTYKSCEADFAVDDHEKWATLYAIESKEKRMGHAEALLREAKLFYENKGFTFGGSVALNIGMRKLYQKLGIKEYR